MACPYNYYKKEETYYPRLYCSLNDKCCVYSKKCTRVEKFIPIEEDIWKECYEFNMELRKNIPNGSKYIEFKRKGYLYVDINDNQTEKIKNTLGDFEQNYIYVKEGIDGYEISLKPFAELKRTYTRKRTDEKKAD